MIQPDFAFCQAISVSAVKQLVSRMSQKGYSLQRLRPYRRGADIKLAALWHSGPGRTFSIYEGTKEKVFESDRDQRAKGLVPIDAVGLSTQNGDRYWVTWGEPPEDSLHVQMHCGLDRKEYDTIWPADQKKGFVPATMQWFASEDHSHRMTLIAVQQKKEPAWRTRWSRYTKFNPDRFTFLNGWVQIDIGTYPEVNTDREKYYRDRYQSAKSQLANNPDDRSAMWSFAWSAFFLRENQTALTALDAYIQADPKGRSGWPYFYRAIVHCRLGNKTKAEQDQAQFGKIDGREQYRQMALGVTTGLTKDLDAALELFKEQMTKSQSTPNYAHGAANGLAYLATELAAAKHPRASEVIDLAVQATQTSAKSSPQIYQDLDEYGQWDVLRTHASFQDMRTAHRLDRNYVGVWQKKNSQLGRDLLTLNPTEHLQQAEELAKKGYRPISLSCLETNPGRRPLISSVWSKPVSREIRSWLYDQQWTTTRINQGTLTLEKALEPAEELLSKATEEFGTEHPVTVMAQSDLAYVLAHRKDLSQAIRQLRNACRTQKRHTGKSSESYQKHRDNLIFIIQNHLTTLKDYNQRHGFLQELLYLLIEKHGILDWRVTDQFQQLNEEKRRHELTDAEKQKLTEAGQLLKSAQTQQAINQPTDAIQFAAKAVGIYRTLLGPTDRTYLKAVQDLAILYYQQE
ncbi:MAG: hypothetical protein KDA84_14930, partial [Planctomycetaceae bacterium]|nr:hypothetical protein [Planctomycetaceae bacterium]